MTPTAAAPAAGLIGHYRLFSISWGADGWPSQVTIEDVNDGARQSYALSAPSPPATLRKTILQALFDFGYGGTDDPTLTEMFVGVCEGQTDAIMTALRDAAPVDLIETVAKAMWDALETDTPWDRVENFTKDIYRSNARGAVPIIRQWSPTPLATAVCPECNNERTTDGGTSFCRRCSPALADLAKWQRLVGEGLHSEHKALRRVVELEAALTLIADHKDKTLLGDGRYDEGAHEAFEQMADIANIALLKG